MGIHRDVIAEREKMPKVRRVLDGGLPVALIEFTPTSACHVDEQTIKHRSLLFIDIEAEVDKMPQESSALRHPKAESALNATRGRIAVLNRAVMKKSSAIPNGQESTAYHR